MLIRVLLADVPLVVGYRLGGTRGYFAFASHFRLPIVKSSCGNNPVCGDTC